MVAFTQKRLHILGDDEIANLYDLPHFTPEEQSEYFGLSPRKTAAFEQLHRIKSRIYAIYSWATSRPDISSLSSALKGGQRMPTISKSATSPRSS